MVENKFIDKVEFLTNGISDTERPAVFLKCLEDVVGEEQGEVCLQCESSKEMVTPVWRKDGTVLSANEKHEFLQFGKSMALIVHSLNKEDAGQYSCDLGTIHTQAEVTVHGKQWDSKKTSRCGEKKSTLFNILFNSYPQICTSLLFSA